jgi:arylsulfatase B
LQAKDEDLLSYGYDVNKEQASEREEKGPTERQIYSAMVSSMDQGIGEILSTLKENQLEENTLVLFFSDNGAETNAGGSSGKLRGDKLQEWEGGVRVPAIIKWPNGFKGGTISPQLTGYIDVLPTLLDVIGQTETLNKPLDGKSILYVLKGDSSIFDRDFYLGHGSLISGEWKLVTPNEKNREMNIDEDILFNIMKDPNEITDVKDSFSDVYSILKQKIISYESIKPERMSPDFWYGREGFVAPKNWNIKRE